MPTLEDRFVGSMLGLALGDALGARFEGGPGASAIWRVINAWKGELRWSDDTEMAVGLAESIVERRGVEADALARRWAEGMTWGRGYGPGARRLLERIRAGADWREANRSVFPEGSFGNGAAMRAAPIGLFYHGSPASLDRAAEEASLVTHAHPLGIEGGLLIARATALALDEAIAPAAMLARLRDGARSAEYRERLETALAWMDAPPSREEVVRRLGNSIKAHESAVTAVYAYCRFPVDFAGMIEFVISLGGDTDTIGAMAGGILGAARGASALPAEQLRRLESRDAIEALGRELLRVHQRA